MFNKIDHNILKLYIIQACKWSLFYLPTFVLFLQDNGLSLQQVFTLQAIFSIAVVLFEIPSGFISDKLGRKNTIVTGTIFGLFGAVAYYLGTNFFMFLTAEILLGIGMSLISGADSALIYDTLKITNNQNQYRKKEGKFQAIGNFSESIASILGGFIAIYSIRATFIPYIVLSLVAVLVALSIVEPPKSEQETSNHSNPFLELYSIVKYSLKDHKEVAALIFYAGLISASTLSMVFFIQPYFLLVGLPIGLFGIAWAALNFSVGIFSLYADLYEIKFGRRFSLISLIFYSVLGYLLLSVFQTLWATCFILLFYFTRGISGPILKDYVNTHIDSSIRATVLSVKNLVGRLIFTIISPFLGYFADTYSLATAFQISAIFFCITGTISLLYLKKHNAL